MFISLPSFKCRKKQGEVGRDEKKKNQLGGKKKQKKKSR
jgi:hypothetical protein